MGKKFSVRSVALAGVVFLSLASGTSARAQTTGSVSDERKTFHVDAQPLSQAALSFSDQAGVQLVLGSTLAQGINGNAVEGAYSISDALNVLLAGTGLSWRYLGNRTITIEQGNAAAVAGGSRVLSAVQVEGTQTSGSDGFADLGGFGSGSGANGSSDVTATEGTGSLTTNGTSVASKTPQSLRETPQSVSVVTHTQIQEEHLNTINDVMNALPGITVTPTTGVNSSFISRGFPVDTYAVDGAGPLSFNTQGAPDDLSEYDHVELVRGSASLYGGASAPGGTINLQRKRPLDHQQFILDGDLGSWSDQRIEVDASSPVAFDGHVRGRVDAVYQHQDFFYDLANERRFKVYATLEADLGSRTTLRVGGSYQWQHDNGYNASGLPRFANGDDVGLPRSASLAAPWNYLITKNSESFLVLDHKFSDDWSFVFNGTRTSSHMPSSLAAISGPVQQPSNTIYGLGYSYSTANMRQYVADAHVSGSFRLFGLRQQLVIGADYNNNVVQSDGRSSLAALSLIDIDQFDPTVFGPKPAFLTDSNAPDLSRTKQLTRQYNLYGNLVISPLKRLHLSGGVRFSTIRETQDSDIVYNFPPSPPLVANSTLGQRENFVPVPSTSINYDIFGRTSIYASWNGIYRPSSTYLAANHTVLPPITGNTYEAGIKTVRAGGKLNASLSIFYTPESNVAIPTSSALTTIGTLECCYVPSGATKSTGMDLEVTGQLTPRWQVQASYMYDDVRYNKQFQDLINGESPVGTTGLAANVTQQPKHQIKIFTTYQLLGALSGLTVGVGFRLDSARYTQGSICNLLPYDPTGACIGGKYERFAFTQKLYTVTDLRLSYNISKRWEVSASLTNIANTKYYAIAGSSASGNFYGEPRKILFSVRARY